jgi:hypothetical protein
LKNLDLDWKIQKSFFLLYFNLHHNCYALFILFIIEGFAKLNNVLKRI